MLLMRESLFNSVVLLPFIYGKSSCGNPEAFSKQAQTHCHEYLGHALDCPININLITPVQHDNEIIVHPSSRPPNPHPFFPDPCLSWVEKIVHPLPPPRFF